MKRSATRVALICAHAVLLLSACVYVPKTTAVYDSDCRIASRQMSMEPVQIASLMGCQNQGCAVFLVAAGATAAASAVISGSIVIAGNAVYWFEKQGRCHRSDVSAGADP